MFETLPPYPNPTFKKHLLLLAPPLHHSRPNPPHQTLLSRVSNVTRPHKLTPRYVKPPLSRVRFNRLPPNRVNICKLTDKLIQQVLRFLTLPQLASAVITASEDQIFGRISRKVFEQKLIIQSGSLALVHSLLAFCQEIPTLRPTMETLNPQQELIQLDSQRTFYKKQNQDILAGLLNGFCKNTGILYIQGMNQVAAHILTGVSSSDSSQRLMCYLYVKAGFKFLIARQFKLLKRLNEDVAKQVRKTLPYLQDILDQNGIPTDTFTTKWFLTLFTGVFSGSQANKVWLLYFLWGWKILVAIAVQIFRNICSPQSVFSFEDVEQQLHNIKNCLRSQAFIIKQVVCRKNKSPTVNSSSRRNRGLSLYLSAGKNY